MKTKFVPCHKQPFPYIFTYYLHRVVNFIVEVGTLVAIICWICFVDQCLNKFVNAHFKGLCKTTFASWNLAIQLVGTYKSKMRGCSSFIQALNSTLVCTLQQSMSHIICCELERFNLYTLVSRYGTRMKFTNSCIDSRFD
jgi:hypothetical protein